MKHVLLLLGLLLIGCISSPKTAHTEQKMPPEWAKSVIWYQIFPERFRNGDPTNDPRPQDMLKTYPESIPTSWMISDWTSDWYQEDPWMDELGEMDFSSKLQLRRYGGDLQGVLDQLDYLEALGITGVYFNPLNDAPSLHKYDPRHWRHIDRNFGPDPAGDRLLIEMEDPIDPDTWQWTAADTLFLTVIDELHRRGIRVIMDYSWNHTGYDFWAVNDIREKGASSDYVNWYEVEAFDDTSTLEDETKIAGWWGFKYLPLIKENVVDEQNQLPHKGNVATESLKQHIYNVSRRWLDPNSDGDYSDGVDGFRLDVATEMTLGWWRDYSAFVKSVNPEALIIAEAWWFDWPDLRGPEKMVTEGNFDALMNYRWFVLSSGLFKQANPKLKPSEFVAWYDSLVRDIPVENQQSMMNIVATHDTPRISTSLFNENRFDQGSKLNENPEYKSHRPDEATWQLLRMYLLHQFTFIGAPHIWNGDELGMWGANDPDVRKPIWWEDLDFDPEESNPYKERIEAVDTVKADAELLAYYKALIRLRNENPVFSSGNLAYDLIDDDHSIFSYKRNYKDKEAIVCFNLSDIEQEVELTCKRTEYLEGLSAGVLIKSEGGKLSVNLPPKTGKVLLSR